MNSKDSLNKVDMDYLKNNTRFDQKAIDDWYKGFKKDCPDGHLTQTKFTAIFKVFFPNGNSEQFVDHFFRTIDADKNGYIDFREFLLAMDIISAGSHEEKLKWAFRMYDVGGDGKIYLDEMTKIGSAIFDLHGTNSNKPEDSAEEHVKSVFSQMDLNSDGYLTQEEFLKGCLQDAYIRQLSEDSIKSKKMDS